MAPSLPWGQPRKGTQKCGAISFSVVPTPLAFSCALVGMAVFLYFPYGPAAGFFCASGIKDGCALVQRTVQQTAINGGEKDALDRSLVAVSPFGGG